MRSSKAQNERRLDLCASQMAEFIGIVDGLLLGDGSIDPNGSLRLGQAKIRQGWLEELADRLKTLQMVSRTIPVLPRDSVIEGRKTHYMGGGHLYTPTYIELQQQRLRWYPDGIKRVPKDVSLAPVAIAYWFCGDGTYSRDGALMFCTNGFRKREVNFLASRLSEAVGIDAYCSPSRPGEFIVRVNKRDDALRLKNFIEPHVPECCRYKFKHVRAALPRGYVQAKLTICQAVEVRSRHADGEKQVLLASEFGVTPSAISRIVRGQVHRGTF